MHRDEYPCRSEDCTANEPPGSIPRRIPSLRRSRNQGSLHDDSATAHRRGDQYMPSARTRALPAKPSTDCWREATGPLGTALCRTSPKQTLDGPGFLPDLKVPVQGYRGPAVMAVRVQRSMPDCSGSRTIICAVHVWVSLPTRIPHPTLELASKQCFGTPVLFETHVSGSGRRYRRAAITT